MMNDPLTRESVGRCESCGARGWMPYEVSECLDCRMGECSECGTDAFREDLIRGRCMDCERKEYVCPVCDGGGCAICNRTGAIEDYRATRMAQEREWRRIENQAASDDWDARHGWKHGEEYL